MNENTYAGWLKRGRKIKGSHADEMYVDPADPIKGRVAIFRSDQTMSVEEAADDLDHDLDHYVALGWERLPRDEADARKAAAVAAKKIDKKSRRVERKKIRVKIFTTGSGTIEIWLGAAAEIKSADSAQTTLSRFLHSHGYRWNRNTIKWVKQGWVKQGRNLEDLVKGFDDLEKLFPRVRIELWVDGEPRATAAERREVPNVDVALIRGQDEQPDHKPAPVAQQQRYRWKGVVYTDLDEFRAAKARDRGDAVPAGHQP